MSLFAALNKYDTPAVTQPTPAQPDYTVVIKNTRGGHTIMICTIEPAPASVIADAAAQHLPLFLPSEINALAGANQEAVTAAIMAKLAMPGSIITSHDENINA